MNRSRVFLAQVLLLGLVVMFTASAPAEDLKDGVRGHASGEGRWRLELSGTAGAYSGKTDRDGDYYAITSVEYEWAVGKRASLGLRAHPLFFYNEVEDKYEDETSEKILGVGAGVTGRMYKNKETRDGLFGEVGVSALWHSRYFKGNSSRVNFLTEAGVGYKFPETHWHVALQAQHISNAGLGGKNAGINGLGLAFGYTF